MQVIDKAYGETTMGTGSVVSIMVKISDDLYRWISWHCESPLQAKQDFNEVENTSVEDLICLFGKGRLIHISELKTPYLKYGVPQYKHR